MIILMQIDVYRFRTKKHPSLHSENTFEIKKNADKSTFFLSIICKKQDILSV